jgi:hypothetical protein
MFLQLIFNLGITRRNVFNFQPQPLYTHEFFFRYKLDKRPSGLYRSSGHCGENRNLFILPQSDHPSSYLFTSQPNRCSNRPPVGLMRETLGWLHSNKLGRIWKMKVAKTWFYVISQKLTERNSTNGNLGWLQSRYECKVMTCLFTDLSAPFLYYLPVPRIIVWEHCSYVLNSYQC